MKQGSYICALHADQEVWETSECYDSKIEAINAGIQGIIEKDEDVFGEEVEEGQTSFAVGQIDKVLIDFENEAINMFDRINEDVYDFCGEVAEDYLKDVDKEVTKEFAELIKSFFEKHDLMPTCFTVQNIETYDIKDLYGSYIENGTFDDFKTKEWRSAFDEQVD